MPQLQVTRTHERFEATYRGEHLIIEPWGAGVLRVRSTRTGLHDAECDSVLLPPTLAPDWSVRELGDVTQISNGDIRVHVSSSGELEFADGEGNPLLTETKQFLASPPARYYVKDRGVRVSFRSDPGERLFGLGQQQHGLLNQKGTVVELLQNNSHVSIPFLLSDRGYGFVWNTPAIGRVEMRPEVTTWFGEGIESVDYLVIAGASPSSIVSRYTDLMGRSPRFPRWASGLWQSRLRYHSPEEVIAVAREYQDRGIPLSAMVIDYFHWPHFGDWRFDERQWPDPAAMVSQLLALGVESMVSVWPMVNERSENYARMRDSGYLMRDGGLGIAARFLDTYEQDGALLHCYDASNPDARGFVGERLDAGYREIGIHNFWVDACEPEIVPQEPWNWTYHAGPGEAVANQNPHWSVQAVAGVADPANPSDSVHLARSAWHGSQRYPVALWSGDVSSSFESLAAQIPAALNVGLCGISWWSSDIGGFYGPRENSSPYLRELLVRWFQFALFTPIMRMHGHRIPDDPELLKVGAPNELWSYGDEVLGRLTRLVRAREYLRDYLHDTLEIASATGTPPLRPLWLGAPNDETAWDVADQFLFGGDILVAPIVEEGLSNRRVYVPEGEWREVNTSDTVTGPRWVNATFGLDSIPAFVRVGTAADDAFAAFALEGAG